MRANGVITGEKIRLRPSRLGDLQTYAHWLAEDDEWLTWDSPWVADINVQEHIEGQRQRILTKRAVYGKLEIETLDGTHIGSVSCYFYEDNPRLLGLGITIPPVSARGHGYGAEAIQLFMAYQRAHRRVDAFFFETWSGNAAAVTMVEKLGFTLMKREKLTFEGYTSYDALTYRFI